MTGPIPGTAEHLRLVTASKVAAIIGVSPWMSPWSLWQEMKGSVQPEPTSDLRERGHLLEPAVLSWWGERHRGATNILSQPWYARATWAGARPDLAGFDEHGNLAVVEAKTAARDDEWGDPGTDEIPERYAVQVQWQMGCAEASVAYVPMLGPRLEFREYIVAFDPDLFEWMEGRAYAFWKSLTADVPPPLDSSVATIATLRRMHPHINPDATVVVPDADIALLATARAAKNAAVEAERSALAPILAAMGDAKYADTPTRSRAAARQASGRGIALKLKGEAA